MNRKLTNDELSQVSEVIAARIGLHFPVERWAILGRYLALAAREFGFYNMNEFIQSLLSTQLNKNLLEKLASYLTNSETYFWREPQVFKALTDTILPELIKSKMKREKSIRIWSAGCSTGEEPYSIAIALYRTIPKITDWDITIQATDINANVLNKAMTGIYNTWSFRNSPPWLKDTYFHQYHDRKYEIIPEIKRMVTFSCNSLTEDNHLSAFGSPDTMDIIFCRNVLMYFTNEWAVKISRDLVNSISEKGWLIVSSCELSQQLFPKLTPVNFPGAIIYQKTRDRYSCPAPSGAITEKEFQFSSTFSSILPLTHSPAQHLNLLQPLNTSTLQPINLSTIQQTPSITEESFTSEINTIRLLAGKGQLKEALSACDKALVSFKLAPRLYFVRASILQELNKSHEAIKSLKQAIYVDPDYIMGHFTLGNLFIRQGNSKNAKRHFSNVLDLLSRYANDEILPDSEGLSAKYIKEIIITSMKTLELR